MMNDDDFKNLVSQSTGIGKVLEAFGLENVGRNHNTARQRIMEMRIDSSHFNPFARKKRAELVADIASHLVSDSSHPRKSIKKYIIDRGLVQYCCAICNNDGEWNGQRLVLVLDHKNGKRRDNRLENLRFLCPNCNSQADTFAGRNNSRCIE